MSPQNYIKRNGLGRRKTDWTHDCPFHEGHEKNLATLGADMKRKVGLRTAGLIVSIMLVIPGVSYLAISRYVETATSDAVYLLKSHITKAEEQLKEIQDQLEQQSSTLRVMNYRLNQLDKTPESPQVWPGVFNESKP